MNDDELSDAEFLALRARGKQLKELHDDEGEHPEYELADWMADTSDGFTSLGYWEWCASREAFDKENPS